MNIIQRNFTFEALANKLLLTIQKWMCMESSKDHFETLLRNSKTIVDRLTFPLKHGNKITSGNHGFLSFQPFLFWPLSQFMFTLARCTY